MESTYILKQIIVLLDLTLLLIKSCKFENCEDNSNFEKKILNISFKQRWWILYIYVITNLQKNNVKRSLIKTTAF